MGAVLAARFVAGSGYKPKNRGYKEPMAGAGNLLCIRLRRGCFFCLDDDEKGISSADTPSGTQQIRASSFLFVSSKNCGTIAVAVARLPGFESGFLVCKFGSTS